jgi:hypothetical protein
MYVQSQICFQLQDEAAIAIGMLYIVDKWAYLGLMAGRNMRSKTYKDVYIMPNNKSK